MRQILGTSDAHNRRTHTFRQRNEIVSINCSRFSLFFFFSPSHLWISLTHPFAQYLARPKQQNKIPRQRKTFRRLYAIEVIHLVQSEELRACAWFFSYLCRFSPITADKIQHNSIWYWNWRNLYEYWIYVANRVPKANRKSHWWWKRDACRLSKCHALELRFAVPNKPPVHSVNKLMAFW